MFRTFWAALVAIELIMATGSTLQATQLPHYDETTKLSSRAKENLAKILRYNTTRQLTPLVERAALNRSIVRKGGPQLGPPLLRPTAVKGTAEIPVLTVMFKDTAGKPYADGTLQKQLFESHATGTLTDYYFEVSEGRLTVTGKVSTWLPLPQNATYYSGNSGCNGLCPESHEHMYELITAALQGNDTAIDYGRFDNDGPDGKANSGDDDGYVDFVAIVHAQSGGECKDSNTIWSHRWSLQNLNGQAFETNDAGQRGAKIRVDDYVIMPALACDNRKPTAIGVFAHEFGHAFGLPDLYDTDGGSEGVGGWDLMGSGSWGGDGYSHPEKPSHMGAWSKEYLGWLKSKEIASDTANFELSCASDKSTAIRIDIDKDRAYLLEYRRQTRFDSSLAGSGLLIWYVDNRVLKPGMKNNTVNADEDRPGLSLIQADGNDDLQHERNRGDAKDVFPRPGKVNHFDGQTTPKTSGTIAVCNIRQSGDAMVFDIKTSTSRCAH